MWFLEFLKANYFLLCLALGTTFMVLRSYRTKRINVFIPIVIVGLALLLSIVYFVEMQTKDLILKDENFAIIPTMCCAIGFMIRPVIIFLFMRMSIQSKLIHRIALGLIVVNALIYSMSSFIFAKDFVKAFFYYTINDIGEPAIVTGPLFYSCHAISLLMIGYFIFTSLKSMNARHRHEATALLICVAFILGASVIETIEQSSDLMNTTIAIACLFYVIHLYQQSSVCDALTGLYDRKAYYSDLDRIENKVSGFILIDVNSLKWLNDNHGHEEGDRAIKTVADTLRESLDSRHMDGYRMGGDEFVVISTSGRLDAIDNTIRKIKEKMATTPYSIAIGFARKENESLTVDDMYRMAEDMMYKDKAEYYRISGKERRKG